MENFNTLLSTLDRSSMQKFNKETADPKSTTDQNVPNIDRTFHATQAEYIYLSSTHRTFYRINRMLGQKVTLNKFRKIKIINLKKKKAKLIETVVEREVEMGK